MTSFLKISNFSVLGSPELKVYFYQQLFYLHVGGKTFQHIQKVKLEHLLCAHFESQFMTAINRQFKFLQLSCIFKVGAPDVVHKLLIEL